MKRFLIFILFVIFGILSNPIIFSSAASAEEKSCYFLATMGDVHVSVHEKQPGSPREISLWSGIIKNGQKQSVKCSTGKVYYNYKPANEDRSYGDNQASCQNDSIIMVP